MSVTQFDLAVIMAVHREGALLYTTLSSYDLAFERLRAHGYTAQLIVTLDRCDTKTLEVFQSYIFHNINDVTSVFCDFGDLGLARNHGISLATATYIATADGDDLISPNYLERSLATAQLESTPSVFIPQYLFSFGSITGITVYPSRLSPNSLAWFGGNYGVSRVLARSEVFQSVPYKARHKQQLTYAFEDWTFNCDCIATGIAIRHVPNIVLFYRRHINSASTVNHNLGTTLCPPSLLFQPDIYLTHAVPSEMDFPYIKTPNDVSFDQLYQSSEEIRDAFRTANFLEPEIGPHLYQSHYTELVTANVTSASRAYMYLCQLLADFNFSDVFLLPSLDQSGVPKHFAHVMYSLYTINPTRSILVICGERLLGECSIAWLPPNALVVDFPELMASLHSVDVFNVLVKLLEHIAPDARIHMSTSGFATAFIRNQATYIKSRVLLLYRFCDPIYNYIDSLYEDGALVAFIREYRNCFTAILYDNQFLLKQDSHRLGDMQCAAFLLNSQVSVDFSVPRRTRSETQKQHGSQIALLWASRFAPQKRLSLLIAIASRLQNILPDVVIYVYGGNANEFSSYFHGNIPDNIKFAGSFSSFTECLVRQYAAFLYTSYFDGLPNVILEALASGLIVIAPDVGGISEVIIDNSTGLLVKSTSSDQNMAAEYVKYLEQIINEPSQFSNLAFNAQDILRRSFSPSIHQKAVSTIISSVTNLP